MSTTWTNSCSTCDYIGLKHGPDCLDFKHPEKNPGYHRTPIPQGKLGELDKILEEVYEAIDAEKQKNTIMVLVELSDIYGAIEAYLEQHSSDITMADLVAMSAATKRAFKSGKRISK